MTNPCSSFRLPRGRDIDADRARYEVTVGAGGHGSTPPSDDAHDDYANVPRTLPPAAGVSTADLRAAMSGIGMGCEPVRVPTRSPTASPRQCERDGCDVHPEAGHAVYARARISSCARAACGKELAFTYHVRNGSHFCSNACADAVEWRASSMMLAALAFEEVGRQCWRVTRLAWRLWNQDAAVRAFVTRVADAVPPTLDEADVRAAHWQWRRAAMRAWKRNELGARERYLVLAFDVLAAGMGAAL